MYKLWTDKQEIFEAKIQLSGATFQNTKCRVVVETEDLNLMFHGEISDSGKCNVPIKRMKSILDEGTIGRMRLEVIADDTYFTPWESDFQVNTSKKATVEVLSQSNEMENSAIKVTVDEITVSDEIIDEKWAGDVKVKKTGEPKDKSVGQLETETASSNTKTADVKEVVKAIIRGASKDKIQELTSGWDVDYKLEVLKKASAIMKKG